MNTSYLIIALSTAVLVSYGFDLLSSRFRTPPLLLLLLMGALLRILTNSLNIQVPYVFPTLSALGTLSLILVVLEGGLDLDIQSDRLSLVRRTGLMALSSILLTTLVLATMLYLLLDESYYKCLINALPFSIVSSSIAGQAVRPLPNDKREFITYETSFAAIISIMLYNFLIESDISLLGATFGFIRDTLTMGLVSVICCFALLYLIGRINHPVKFLPIISVLLLVYAIANIYELSSLLLVLIFGLFLNNTELFIRGRLARTFKSDLFEQELDQFKNLTAEGAFIVRTFFFLLFGYATNLSSLIDTDALIVSALFLVVIFAVRWPLLRLIYPGDWRPLNWIAPRGLITILLYTNIPQALKLTGFREGILTLVVILTAVFMAVGTIRYRPSE
ncbi:cation:proton antiporter [Fibrella forsythiae]|uniref:Cation:proton antiporter n=1 Tax=Fibrella forsythiae TaxID=2817061 RepID=A0ABS3JFR2_9BACT|nr:cation:proton antiporter [Fibrella forsythiae]MBO0948835.1 cation:proton antiporter [Fibrella forsythiae]